MYGDEYIKTKTKSYGDTINTNFQAKKYQKKYTIHMFVCDIIRLSLK